MVRAHESVPHTARKKNTHTHITTLKVKVMILFVAFAPWLFAKTRVLVYHVLTLGRLLDQYNLFGCIDSGCSVPDPGSTKDCASAVSVQCPRIMDCPPAILGVVRNQCHATHLTRLHLDFEATRSDLGRICRFKKHSATKGVGSRRFFWYVPYIPHAACMAYLPNQEVLPDVLQLHIQVPLVSLASFSWPLMDHVKAEITPTIFKVSLRVPSWTFGILQTVESCFSV